MDGRGDGCKTRPESDAKKERPLYLLPEGKKKEKIMLSSWEFIIAPGVERYH